MMGQAGCSWDFMLRQHRKESLRHPLHVDAIATLFEVLYRHGDSAEVPAEGGMSSWIIAASLAATRSKGLPGRGAHETVRSPPSPLDFCPTM